MAVNPSDGHDFVTLELEEGTDECEDNSSLCLIRKILTSKALNKQAVSQVSITSWLDNVYLFKFGNEEDKTFILRTAPWSVMGNLLVLQPHLIDKSISEMNFTYSPFWVQVHGLTMEKMTRQNRQIIAKTIGMLVGVEAPTDGLLLAKSFLRIRVDINTSLLLPRGFMLKRQKPNSTGKTDLWVEFKYEHLSDFCYDCGRIGHDNKSCKFVTREEGKLSGYGPELRTGVARNLGLAIEYYRDQIDGLEDNLQPILSQKKIPTPTNGGGMHGRSEHGQGPNTASTLIPSRNSMVLSQSPSEPAYYVTEPSDNATSQISPQALFPNCPHSSIQCDTPSPPTKAILISLCQDAPESLLSSAFTGLSLKRKAPDETYILPTPTKIPKLDYKTSIAPLSLEPVPVADKGSIPRI
ncbi:hypothetical protein ACSBR2_003908 [Camellia fascicularis]